MRAKVTLISVFAAVYITDLISVPVEVDKLSSCLKFDDNEFFSLPFCGETVAHDYVSEATPRSSLK